MCGLNWLMLIASTGLSDRQGGYLSRAGQTETIMPVVP
jgi:hypothetical protein